MKFLINGVTSIENIQNKNKFIWKISSQKRMVSLLVCLIVGLALLIYGLIDPFGIKHFINNKLVTIYNINIFFSIGLTFLITFSFGLYILIYQKKQFFRKLDRIIHKIKDLTYFYEVDEIGIRYFNSEIKVELKWTKFSGFYIVQDFICLMDENELALSLMITRSEISEMELAELLDVIKKNVIQVDINGNIV